MHKRNVLIPVLALLATTLALASVFTYYPLTIRALPVAPGVVFEPGSNAREPDIGVGNFIEVVIGDNATSASLTIHPTYQENYYKDIIRIRNGDDDAMRIFLIFTSLNNLLPSGSVIKIFFYEGATKVKELDITNPTLNTPINIGVLSSGTTWQIDVYVYIPEGYSIANAQYSAGAKLVSTPSGETPPSTPSNGR